MEKNPEFFIKIENPVVFRRTLLEASKNTLESLRDYERSKEIRTKKIKLTMMLNSIVNDILILLDRLKTDLPSTQLRQEDSSAKKGKSSSAKKIKSTKKQASKPLSTINLEEVEKRLKSLR